MNNSIKKIAFISILAALSTVFYIFGPKFPLPIFPNFLDIQFSNLPALIGGFVTGPLGGALIVIIRFIIKLPFTSTAGVGEFADLIIGVSVVLTAAFIYKRNKTMKGAIVALVVSSLVWTLVAVVANYFLIVPFYIRAFMNGDVNIFIGMLSMIPGVDETNYMARYTLYAVIPFNILLSTIVNVITFIVYKRVSDLFKHLTN